MTRGESNGRKDGNRFAGRARLLAWLFALVPGCETPSRPEPSAEFLQVRPQTIAVAEPYGDPGELERRVGLVFRTKLPSLGYRVVAAGEPADAELRYYVIDPRTGRYWDTGNAYAVVKVQAELRSTIGMLWQAEGAGSGTEEEFREEDVRHGLLGIMFGATVDALGDQIVTPDHSDELEEAVHLAVQNVLATLPERLPPMPAPH